MSEKLLPCPYCGNIPEEDPFGDVFCRCSLFERGSIWPLKKELWQRRIYPPEVQAVLEAAKEYVKPSRTITILELRNAVDALIKSEVQK